MELTKIHNVYENIHDYHAVRYNEQSGSVTTQRADYMALATAPGRGTQMLPMLLDASCGKLKVCHDIHPVKYYSYVGIARPGDDVLSMVTAWLDNPTDFNAWLKREGITELIVPYGRS